MEGLRDIEAGQHLVVIFHFHRSPGFSPALLRQTSGHTGREMGVFSTCSPIMPSPIGMSVLEVLGIKGSSIDVKRLDMLDGTPILDIKPYKEDRADRAICVPTRHYTVVCYERMMPNTIGGDYTAGTRSSV